MLMLEGLTNKNDNKKTKQSLLLAFFVIFSTLFSPPMTMCHQLHRKFLRTLSTKLEHFHHIIKIMNISDDDYFIAHTQVLFSFGSIFTWRVKDLFIFFTTLSLQS